MNGESIYTLYIGKVAAGIKFASDEILAIESAASTVSPDDPYREQLLALVATMKERQKPFVRKEKSLSTKQLQQQQAAAETAPTDQATAPTNQAVSEPIVWMPEWALSYCELKLIGVKQKPYNPQSRTPYHAFQTHLNLLNFKPGDLICVGLYDGKMKDRFALYEDLLKSSTIDELIVANEGGQNIYICMAPLSDRRRIKSNIASVRHFFIEKDENGDELLAKIREDVRAGSIPAPAVMVESSPGKLQVTWSVPADANITVAQAEAVNKQLQQRYAADAACVDAARYLRACGFMNLKYPDRPHTRFKTIRERNNVN
jgi:hypothetical protein